MKSYINQQDMKQSNIGIVLSLIRTKGPLTRKQISEKTNMSWGVISKITAILLEEGYVIEKKAELGEGAGPIPSYLEINTDEYFSIGIDVNDIGMKGVLINLKNETVKTYLKDAEFTTKDLLLANILEFVEEIIADAEKKRIVCVGISMQGIVDAKAGVSIRIPGRMHEWRDVPIAYIVESKTGIPTHIEHDPICVLYASCEANPEDTILIRAGRGVGMGVVMNKEAIDKPGIFEIGHTVVVKDGLPCQCGKNGCLEQYSSMRGLEKRSGMSFEALCEKAEKGEADARRYFDEAADHLAYAIGNISHLLAIRNIVLCGRLWDKRDLVVDRFMYSIKATDPEGELKFSFTDPANAAIGAAMIASNIVLSKIK